MVVSGLIVLDCDDECVVFKVVVAGSGVKNVGPAWAVASACSRKDGCSNRI